MVWGPTDRCNNEVIEIQMNGFAATRGKHGRRETEVRGLCQCQSAWKLAILMILSAIESE